MAHIKTDKKYNIIYADPPWKQSKGGKKNVRKNKKKDCNMEKNSI